MISDKINLKINPTLLVNLTFCFLPISFIFGNLITNINTLLLCVLGIFHLKSKILEIKFDRTIKIIFLFFLVIFFSTSLSFLKSFYLKDILRLTLKKSKYLFTLIYCWLEKILLKK